MWLLELVNLYRRRRAFLQVREGFAVLGHPIDHLSDDEIEDLLAQDLRTFGLGFREAGVSYHRGDT